MENKNVIYTVGGIIGAALIAWGSIYTGKFNNERKDKEKAKQEFMIQDSVRVAENTLLAIQIDSVTTENQAKDIALTNKNMENNKLKHELYDLNVKYDSQGAKYSDALGTIDSITAIINTDKQEKKALEVIIVNNQFRIKGLEQELGGVKKLYFDEQKALKAKTDTIGTLQNYLNIYMVNKTPIKPKHAEKVYLPGDLRLLPTDVVEIKEIKALNKEYKNK